MEVRYLLVSGSVNGVGAEWQGAGNAQLGTGKFGQKRRNLDCQPGRGDGRGSATAKVAAKFSRLPCAYFIPQKKTATNPPQISPQPWPKNLVCHGLLREKFEEASPENSTTRLRDREVCERWGGCGIPRSGVDASARSVSGASVETAWVALGQSTYFLKTLGLLGLHLMGIDLKVPIASKPSDGNGKPTLIDSYMCFRGKGLLTQKEKSEKYFTAKLCTLPARERVNIRLIL